MRSNLKSERKFPQNVWAGVGKWLLVPVLLTSFLAAFVVQLGFILSAAQTDEAAALRRLEGDALRLVKAIFDVWSFPAAGDMVRVLEQNIPVSDLRGGRLFRDSDAEGHVFGEAPQFSPADALRGPRTSRYDPEIKRLDVFVSHEKTALQYDMILRLDATGALESAGTNLSADVLMAALQALVGTLAIVPVLLWLVLRPLRRLQHNVLKATRNPAHADDYMSRLSSGNEIGRLGRAIDALLKSAAVTYRQQLQSVGEYINESPLAVLQLDADGALVFANEPALRFLHPAGLAEPAAIGATVCKFDGDSEPVSLIQSLENGRYARRGIVWTRGGEKRAIVAARSITHKTTGAVHHFFTFVDIEDITAQSDALVAEHGEMSKLNGELNRRVFELKQFLESCLSIIGGGKSAGRARAQDPERIVWEWHAAARKGGLSSEQPPLFSKLPAVKGSADGIASIFRHALTYVCLQSPIDGPQIDIRAQKTDGGQVRFFILDFESNAEKDAQSADRPEDADAQLFLLALKKILRQEGGKWIEVGRERHANCVAFQLPAAEASGAEGREAV